MESKEKEPLVTEIPRKAGDVTLEIKTANLKAAHDNFTILLNDFLASMSKSGDSHD